MTSLGYFLSCEAFTPDELVRQAVRAEAAGFERLWISDHFHPWNDKQGQSPFVWSVIGALSQACSLPVTTAVTCPIMRTRPAVIAQAAATSAVQPDGNFVLGLGTGEALNEHITGEHWPPAGTRLEMLEESIEVMRELLTGKQVSHTGRFYTVENARIYALPKDTVPMYISAFGPRAARFAGRLGDGFQTMMPSSERISEFREAGGAGKPCQAGFKVCHAASTADGVRTAHDLWANEYLPGELGQILPTPTHFEQASTMVPESAVEEAVPCGPDQDGFFDFWESKVAPELAA